MGISGTRFLQRAAMRCSHCKRCTSYSNSVRHTPVVCQNDCTCNTVQFALSDRKMCLVFYKPKSIPMDDRFPLRSSITANTKSTRAFQRAINQGSTPPLTSSKWGSNRVNALLGLRWLRIYRLLQERQLEIGGALSCQRMLALF